MTPAVHRHRLAFLQHATLLAVQHDERDLTMRQMTILLHLAGHPEPAPSVRELARLLEINKPGVTRSLDRLELREKFVRRTTSPFDGRVIEARITAAGEAFVRDWIAKLGPTP